MKPAPIPGTTPLEDLLTDADDLLQQFEAIIAAGSHEPATVQTLAALADRMAKRFDDALRQVAIRERHDAQQREGGGV